MKGKTRTLKYRILFFYFCTLYLNQAFVFAEPSLANQSNEIDKALLESIAGAVVTAMAAKEDQELSKPEEATTKDTTKADTKPQSAPGTALKPPLANPEKDNKEASDSKIAEKKTTPNPEDRKTQKDIKHAVQSAISKTETAAASTEKRPPKTTKPIVTKEKAEHFNTILVQNGDSLQNIAVRLYGRNDRYLEIYQLNRDIIKDPNIVPAGEILRVLK